MELCDRCTLGEWLRHAKRVVDQEASLDVMRQLVRGLHHVHSCGVIHRDIKPTNIFMQMGAGSGRSPPAGSVKLGDFGLSTETIPAVPNPEESSDQRERGERRQQQQQQQGGVGGGAAGRSGSGPEAAGIVDYAGRPGLGGRAGESERHTAGLGTPTYASPEQISGSDYTEKTDIYSLGMVLFELFNPTETVMERHLIFHKARGGRFPSEFDEKYPKEAQLCRLMLSQRPLDRPSTWDLAQSLMLMGMEDKSRRLADQDSLLRSMQNTIGKQRNEIEELSRGHIGSMQASGMAPKTPKSDIDVERGGPFITVAEAKAAALQVSRVESRIMYTGSTIIVYSQQLPRRRRECVKRACVRVCNPSHPTPLSLLGHWTPHQHVQCFWGFRAQIYAVVVAIFTSEHSMQCEARIDASGEYGTWSLPAGDSIIKVHVDLYHMLARMLWQKSLAWMLGPTS